MGGDEGKRRRLTDAPGDVSAQQLREVGIRLRKPRGDAES